MIQGAWQYNAPRPSWVEPAELTQKIYLVILKADGYADFELPVSSILMRLRDAQGSYIRVTVPNPTGYTDAILDRTGGRMHIYGGFKTEDGIRQVEEIIYANIQNMYFNTGGSNVLVLAGTRYMTHSNPREVSIAGASKITKDEAGRFSVRAPMDLFCRPLDIATVDGGTFEVDLMTCVILSADAYMDVEGATYG